MSQSTNLRSSSATASRLLRQAALVAAGMSAITAQAASGTFSTLSYNVAGLPQGVSSATTDRTTATKLISCYVKAFDIVNVQEDFNYHAALYDTCDDHAYRSPTSGGAGVGSGLNMLSRFPYEDWDRVRWKDCNGVDCLTPKGFTMARVRLASGVFVDVYNLHAQAQTEPADLTARRKNILQLLSYIENESAGNAVIVFGDTNTRYTRSGDNIGQFLRHGFTDVWVQRTRNGSVPAAGADALTCSPLVTSGNCEIVDKFFYRSGANVTLSPTSYQLRTDAVDAKGADLSDHPPISATWSWSTADKQSLSDKFGGPHGTNFNDSSLLPASPAVKTLNIRTAERVDRVETVLSNGIPFGHGGTGGNLQTLTLGSGEYLKSMSACTVQVNGQTRVSRVSFTTSANRSLSGGTATSSCTTYSAPSGWAIVAFHGRAGDEVDKLGVVYAPVASNSGGVAQRMRFVNKQSGRCMDLSQSKAANGSNVAQWYCNGGANQTWLYDAASGLVRSGQDPHYCLDNTGSFDNGADIILWTCSGNANQRFTYDSASGALRMRTYLEQAVDGNMSDYDIRTYQYWNGANQSWNLTP